MKVIADTGKRDSWSLQHNRVAHIARLADEKAEKNQQQDENTEQQQTPEPAELDPVEAVHNALRGY